VFVAVAEVGDSGFAAWRIGQARQSEGYSGGNCRMETHGKSRTWALAWRKEEAACVVAFDVAEEASMMGSSHIETAHLRLSA
jgi:hypothetical protein